jgi:gluconokinase
VSAEANQPLALVLTGVSGSGKSSVGAQLAQTLGATFLEGDNYHPPANVAKMRAGVALEDEDRWPWLRALAIAIADHAREGRSVVASCSALKRRYREALTEASGRPLVFVQLSVDVERLELRVGARHHPFMSPALLQSQLAALEPLEPDERGTTIRAGESILQTVNAIERWLRTGALSRG